ncbi:MAG: TlyA family RNA methyltransferase [Clostridia bacterium]
MTQKKRLDVAVFEQGLAESRERAQAYIMAGDVYLNGVKASKAGQQVKPDDVIEVRTKSLPYVSRGGLKLEKAMQSFPILLTDKICMDVGASTGGFTDCMLQNGAAKVYSIDVGYGQLAWKLRSDGRVVNLERTNFRYVTREQVPDAVDFSSVDVSFISLSLILPVLHGLLAPKGEAVCLIKPQFEAGKDKVGKNGVVRDHQVHAEVIEKVERLALENQFDILGLDFSPVKGPKGNIEYLIYLKKAAGEAENRSQTDVTALVKKSHEVLDGGEKNDDRVGAQS